MGILVKKEMACNQLICPQCGNTGSQVELEVSWYQDFLSLLLGFLTFPLLLGLGFLLPYIHRSFMTRVHICSNRDCHQRLLEFRFYHPSVATVSYEYK